MLDWFLYMIRCRDGSLYTGITTDVARRFSEHSEQGDKCARYLRGRAPLELVFYIKVGGRSRASQLELLVKRFSKSQKELIVECHKKRHPPESECPFV
jgi:putative endonuclease